MVELEKYITKCIFITFILMQSNGVIYKNGYRSIFSISTYNCAWGNNIRIRPTNYKGFWKSRNILQYLVQLANNCGTYISLKRLREFEAKLEINSSMETIK